MKLLKMLSVLAARPQYQVQVTRMKAVDDAPTGLVQRDLLAAHIPKQRGVLIPRCAEKPRSHN